MSDPCFQSALTTAVVYDLRTSISILRARMDTFADQAPMHQFRDDLQRLNQILDMLLEMNRIRQLPEFDNLDLEQICAQLVDYFMLPAMLQGKSISLVPEDETTLPVRQAGLLFLALRNLAGHLLRLCREWSGVEIRLTRDAVRLLVCPDTDCDGENSTEDEREIDYDVVFAERTISELGGALIILADSGGRKGYQVTMPAQPKP